MLNDLCYAWLQLRRTPGFTAVAVITLGLGIGANTTCFGLIDAAIWRPMRATNFADTYDLYVVRPPWPHVPGQRRSREPTRRAPAWRDLDSLRSHPELGILAVTRVGSRLVTAQTPFEAGRLTMRRQEPLVEGEAGHPVGRGADPDSGHRGVRRLDPGSTRAARRAERRSARTLSGGT